jgi:hypothetical protein
LKKLSVKTDLRKRLMIAEKKQQAAVVMMLSPQPSLE